MVPQQVFFYVVFDFCPVREDFFISAVLSKKEEAEQYKKELDTSQDKDISVVRRMTMEQLKLVLVKDQMMTSMALVEKLLG